ncbi:MAG: hypothetical protein AAGK78_07350, partial [Planctomycetota bacterium]
STIAQMGFMILQCGLALFPLALLHIVAHFIFAFAIHGIFIVAPVVILAPLVAMAQFGNAIEEIGPEGQNELPTLLRNVELYEDVFKPILQLVMTVLICLGPAYLAWQHLAPLGPAGEISALVAAAIGWALMPAFLLTLISSGSIDNLMPHRIVGTAASCGVMYLLLVAVVLPIGLAGYTWGLAAMFDGTVDWIEFGYLPSFLDPKFGELLAYGGLLVGFVFLALTASMLGHFYRRFHGRFPWVNQRHISTRTDKVKLAERRRAAEVASCRMNPDRVGGRAKKKSADSQPIAVEESSFDRQQAELERKYRRANAEADLPIDLASD